MREFFGSEKHLAAAVGSTVVGPPSEKNLIAIIYL